MRCIRNKVICEFERGWIGPDTSCEYHPCHHRGQDCTYCYCPFYPCLDADLGKMLITSKDKEVWDCSDCLFIHRTDVCRYVSSEVERLGIKDPDDPRLKDIFIGSKKKFFRMGTSIMVLGATSDAGKSLMVTAICRMLLDMGYTVTPLKTQNMSLNSVATSDGSEIAMIQALQAKAAGITRPGFNINPILLKPMGDTTSQVMVHGKPFGEYDVVSYYRDFVPGPGIEAVKKSVEYLRKRYDFVVMEGAGSPAEINIYDTDIANMKAAEIADASCMLVINTERGGSFAYALGTLELIRPDDRERIKAVLFNNLRGDMSGFLDGVEKFKKIANIPVLGVVPHLELDLPKEDSSYFRGSGRFGSGKIDVAVIRLPRISNFNDLDPLGMEDVTVTFTTDPNDVENADAIIIPGTKNTVSDMKWMRSTGIADAVLRKAGKVPILGICGGYQIMCDTLTDDRTTSETQTKIKGLGLFTGTTEWNDSKCVRQVSGTLIPNEGCVHGYEVHIGKTVTDEEPLFSIDGFDGCRDEGSLNIEKKLFGTYLHGVFDTPAFRRYFLSFVPSYVPGPDRCHSDVVEENIQKLADSFASCIDMGSFKELYMEGRR